MNIKLKVDFNGSVSASQGRNVTVHHHSNTTQVSDSVIGRYSESNFFESKVVFLSVATRSRDTARFMARWQTRNDAQQILPIASSRVSTEAGSESTEHQIR